MPNATRILALAAGLTALAACGQDRSDQNIAIENNSAATDVEMLPPDESTATPSDELANGATDADSNAAYQTDGY